MTENPTNGALDSKYGVADMVLLNQHPSLAHGSQTPTQHQTKGSNSFQGQSPYAALILGESGSAYRLDYLPPEMLIKYFDTVTPVSLAVNRIATAVGSLPIHLINKSTRKPAPDHPAFALINRPNKRMQKIRHDLFRDYTIWRIIHGNAYLVLTGATQRPPLELHLLNPLQTTPEAGANGYAERLVYHTPSSSQDFTYRPKNGTYVNAANSQSVYHVANFNARFGFEELEGASELSSLYYAINHYIISSQHNLSLLDNGARPSGAFVLTSDKDGTAATLTDEEFKRLKAEIAMTYSGAGNAGRPMLLEGGLEWKQMQMTPRDLDFHTLRQDSEEAIYKNLNIPVQLVMSQKVTVSNFSNIRLEFYQNRVLPLGDNLCEHLNNAVLTRYPDGGQYAFEVNRDEIDVLQEQRIAKRQSIENSTVKTIDEKRAMFHDGPIEGGDKIVDPNGRPIAGKDADLVVQPIVSAAPAATPSDPQESDDEGGEDEE